jgi:Crinkler effector protein N-terminal domain
MNETITLWCNVKGDSSLFKVEIAPERDVADLRKLIHKEAFADGQFPLAKDLVLYKVSCSYVAHL